jgi:hypothetical protein
MNKKKLRVTRYNDRRFKCLQMNIKFVEQKKFKFFLQRKLTFRTILNKINYNKNIIYNLYIKITPIKNNLFINIFLKYKKYKLLFLNSFGLIKINGKKKRKAPISKKLIALSTRLFFKRLF